MMQLFARLALVILLVVPTGNIFAQVANTCQALVDEAFETIREACMTIRVGETCYGNGQVTASLRDPLSAPPFITPGDHISVRDLGELSLQSLSLDDRVWSLALTRLQGADQVVGLLAFGDVLIHNRAVDGLEDPQPFHDLIVQTGWGSDDCAGMSMPGLLIQTSQCLPVQFRINGVMLQFDCTVFIQAQPGRALRVYVLDGNAAVDVDGIRTEIARGMSLDVPLDQASQPSGPALEPVPYAPSLVDALPLVFLRGDIIWRVNGWEFRDPDQHAHEFPHAQ
jgi:hypothetical protein